MSDVPHYVSWYYMWSYYILCTIGACRSAMLLVLSIHILLEKNNILNHIYVYHITPLSS